MIRDVRGETFDLEVALRPFVHPTDARRPETVDRQGRALRRWTTDRPALLARPSWDPERLDRWQLDRVRLLVESAFASHPFYHRLYSDAGYESGSLVTWDDYRALPVIGKRDIVENFDLFTVNRALPPSDVFTSCTSGSSGVVLNILQDDATSDTGQSFYMRFYEQLLGRRRRREEWVYEIYLGGSRYSSLDGDYPVFTLSQECPIELAVEHLRRLRPSILSAFPSYLLRLADSCDGLDALGVLALCTNSEPSTRTERERLGERFGAPVRDEYSSEELYLIATECPAGRYHVVEDNVRVDAERFDGGPPEIVGTSLHNTYMPFIRYRQGDVIAFGDPGEACRCGSRFRILREFSGRSDQLLRRTDGSVLGPDRVMGLYDATLLAPRSRLAEFRIVQEAAGTITVLLRAAPPARAPDAGLVRQFREGLERLVDDPAITVRTDVVDALPEVPSFKRRLITSAFVPRAEPVRQA